jgi:hypothetical protein
MSETVKWSALTAEERDHLVAEKVLEWKQGICDGEMGELPCSPDGWFCQKCGYSGCWGDDYEHEEIPPRYTQSMSTAWKVVEHITQPPTKPLGINAPNVRFAQWWAHADLWAMSEREAANAICLAVLRVCGVEVEP